MAIYYAIAYDDFIQQDLNTGQLEIYETKKQAEMNCPIGYVVIPVRVKRKYPKYVGLSSNNLNLELFEEDLWS